MQLFTFHYNPPLTSIQFLMQRLNSPMTLCIFSAGIDVMISLTYSFIWLIVTGFFYWSHLSHNPKDNSNFNEIFGYLIRNACHQQPARSCLSHIFHGPFKIPFTVNFPNFLHIKCGSFFELLYNGNFWVYFYHRFHSKHFLSCFRVVTFEFIFIMGSTVNISSVAFEW